MLTRLSVRPSLNAEVGNAHRPKWAALLLTSLVLLSGCSDDFVGQEMHLGPDDKPRPLTLEVDPPEAAPGETVTATLTWFDNNPSGTDVRWRLAQEYDAGLYGVDPVERRFLDLDAEADVLPPVADSRGYVRQVVSFVVPDSALYWSPSLEGMEEDEEIAELIAELFPEQGEPPAGRDEVAQLLSSLQREDIEAMDPEEQAYIRGIADLFACQVRLRVRLENSHATVDVTKGLTVRYSSNLGSENVNTNPTVTQWEIAAIPRENAEWKDLDEFADDIVTIPIAYSPENSGEAPMETVVDVQSGWTYYLRASGSTEFYASPFTGTSGFEERIDYRWLWQAEGSVDSEYAFLVSDDGEKVDMEELDDVVRLDPPPETASSVRLYLVLRDDRPEWERYQWTPGIRMAAATLTFQ